MIIGGLGQHRGCRLKACSACFAILLEAADMFPIGSVLFAAEMFVPFLLFLRQCCLEGGGLAAMEVQGCAFEEGGVLRDEDVLDG